MAKKISADELAELIDNAPNFVLIDTLPSTAYDDGHLPGAINIVSDEILTRASREIPDRGKMIVVYCASAACQRAGLAAERLASLGYTNVFHYVEGKRGWIDSGRELEAS
ncbi:MAG: rhodanese-like domain-containing protein [Betaproteobacteria bacterium]|nr:rhodanese-like domain-containing protein [Betaproteobacteria bacterium]